MKSGFLCTLLTPILKASKGKSTISFYSIPEFNAWKDSNSFSGWKIKYYKGLGTSTPAEAREWFKDLHEIKYEWDDKTDESISLAFDKKRSDDRKEWLATYDKDRILVLSDARDVFCVRDAKAFTAAFEYFKVPIVVSGEMFLASRIDVPENFIFWNGASLDPYFKHWNTDPKKTIRKFVCAGLMAGRAGALYDMWDWVLANNYTDDQLGTAMYVRTFPEKVRVDHDAIVLHSTDYGVDAGTFHVHYQKQDAPTFAELFGTGAFFLHIPGLFFKGQGYLYKCIKNILNEHDSDALLKVYGKPYPPWDEFKDLPPLQK
jgi:hypothetical protein